MWQFYYTFPENFGATGSSTPDLTLTEKREKYKDNEYNKEGSYKLSVPDHESLYAEVGFTKNQEVGDYAVFKINGEAANALKGKMAKYNLDPSTFTNKPSNNIGNSTLIKKEISLSNER